MSSEDISCTCECCKNLTAAIESLQESLKVAFPDGAQNHGEYHQELIDAAREQKKFWADLSADLKHKGIIAILFILIGMVSVKIFGPDSLALLLKAIK